MMNVTQIIVTPDLLLPPTSYVDKKTIIAVGSSGSDISADGGKTWKNLDKESYNAVQAKGKNAIWAVGTNGLVSKFTLNK